MHNSPSESILVKYSVPVPCVITLDFDNKVSNLISLPGYTPWIKVGKVVISCVINAFSLSHLKLFKVDNPVPSVIKTFSFSSVELNKFVKLVLYEFNVSNTFKPDINIMIHLYL